MFSSFFNGLILMIRLLVLRLVREGVVGNDRIMYMQLRHTEPLPVQILFG